MHRVSPSPDVTRATVWVRWVALIGLIGLLAAPRVMAGRITILGEERKGSKERPVEISIDGDSKGVRVSIEGDSGVVVAGPDSIHLRGGFRVDGPGRRAYRRVAGSGKDLVSVGHDVVVKTDEVVQGDCVSILGSVCIDGKVMGDAVAVGGKVTLGPGAIVQGDAVSVWGDGIELGPNSVVAGQAVAVGGPLEEDPTAHVGERVQVGFMPAFGHRGLGILGKGWITFLLHLIVVGLLGWILVKLGRPRWDATIATLRARGWESLLAGVGAGILYGIAVVPLLLVIALILVAIVVGIPLVPMVLLLILILPIPGYAAIAILLGQSVRGESSAVTDPPGARSYSGAFLLGHVLLCSPYFLAAVLRSALGAWFSLAGVFLLVAWGVNTLAIAFGWGALLLSRMGRRYPQRSVTPAPQPAVPAPPAL